MVPESLESLATRARKDADKTLIHVRIAAIDTLGPRHSHADLLVSWCGVAADIAFTQACR
jgi:hypothetical protein